MALDDAELGQARAAAIHLADAERDLELARTTFRHAVRRLHLTGGSMREIAQALGLSHQRVKQIVDDAGGARPWRSRGADDPDLVCTFCERDKDNVAKLIAGPGIYICNDCVDVAEAARTEAAPRSTALTEFLPLTGRTGQCSFCGKRKDEVDVLLAGPGGRVCNHCLDLCGEILREPPTPPG